MKKKRKSLSSGLIVACSLIQFSCEDSIVLEKKGSDNNTQSSISLPIDTSTLGSAPGEEEWIEVPANAGGVGLKAFAVMKYEAKAFVDTNSNSSIDGGEISEGAGIDPGTHAPVSIANNLPWRSIDATNASTECQSLGANYDLISNEEWMAISRDIESQGANWTGNTVGSGCLFRGNSGEATVGTGATLGDSCGYDSAAQTEGGTGRDLRAKYMLSNGSEIFDLSGNLTEFVDWDKNTAGFQIGSTSCADNWTELPVVACGAIADVDFNSNHGGYTSTEGVGRFRGGVGGTAHRGGTFIGQEDTGLYSLNFQFQPTSGGAAIGFRCVYRP